VLVFVHCGLGFAQQDLRLRRIETVRRMIEQAAAKAKSWGDLIVGDILAWA
jgi:hypothetical protein